MIVACPKCATPQDVGSSISPEGNRINCASCGVAFVVRRASTMAMTAGNRYFIRRKTGNSFGPFVEGVIASMLAQRKLDGTEEISQDGRRWDPITSVPSFAAALAKAAAAPEAPGRASLGRTLAIGTKTPLPDLPAPREAVPRVGDLPAPRESIPRVGNLPAPRESIPKVGNLPAPRESIPKVGNLPAPREAVPKGGQPAAPAPGGGGAALPTFDFDDFTPPGVRELPEPTSLRYGEVDLPAPRGQVPRPTGSTIGLDLPAPKAAAGTAARATLSGPRPQPRATPPPPPSLDDLDLSLDLPGPRGPAPQSSPLNLGGSFSLDGEPEPEPTPLSPLDLEEGPPAAAAGLMSGPERGSGGAEPGSPDLGLSLDGAPEDALALDLPSDAGAPTASPDFALSFETGPSEPTPGPVLPARPSETPRSSADLDLGLAFDTSGDVPADEGGQPLDGGAVSPPFAARGEKAALDAGGANPAATLAAPARSAAKAKTAAPPKRTKRRPRPSRSLVAGLGALLLLGGGAAAVLHYDLPAKVFSGPDPSKFLVGMEADILRDHYPAYAQAGQRLAAAAGENRKSAPIRVAAATILLEAVVGRGADKSWVGQAEALLAEIRPDAKVTPELRRARALLSVARGRWKQADVDLGGQPVDAGGHLVHGWRQLGEGNVTAAAAAFSRAAAADPRRVLAGYALARAREAAGEPTAAAAYDAVLARNATHFGAALGAARLAKVPPQDLLAKATDLAARAGSSASPAELAEAHVLAGHAARALGRVAESDASYARALAADPTSAPANLAQGEVLLADGRYAEALSRFQTAGPGGGGTLDGKFGLAGALVGSGKSAEGLAVLKEAGAQKPGDPRASYWLGRAAELAATPDLAAAETRYRDALKMNPAFLPASLHLAATLVRQARAPEALAILRHAEEAGSPKEALLVAWGQALLASRDLGRAKEAYRKALESNPKLEAARLGLAASLEAGGELADAKVELDKLLADAPATPGLRERIAGTLLKLGKREEALAVYQDEIAKGKPTLALRVATADLALELGQADLAKTLADKVAQEDARVEGALFVLARALRAKGNISGALQEFKRAIAYDRRPQVHYEYGRTLAQAGKIPAALDQLKKASVLPEARRESAVHLMVSGDIELARAELEEAVKMAPQLSDAWVMLGNCYDRLAKRDLAEAAWRSAIKMSPELAEARYQLGKMEMDVGRAGVALEHLRLVKTPTPPWDSDYYFQLGEAERAKGSRAAAVSAFKKYLELAPEKAPARPEAERQVRVLGGRP